MRKSVLIVLTLPFLGLATGAQANAALAQKSGCMTCHTVDQKRVGPAYRDIAKKYKGDKTAPTQLAAKVKAGGKGVWGPVPMPPNGPRVSDADIKALVAWILAGAK